MLGGKKKDGGENEGIRGRATAEIGSKVGLMKWFPLLFANVNMLFFFTRAIFDNIAIWEDSSPAIFSHYKANYSYIVKTISR